MAKDLPSDPRLPVEISKATIQNLIDGVVELVTNSDDSYRRLEGEGIKVGGEIQIYINRKKGGICEKLVVKDFAEAMTKDKLKDAIIFGKVETSGPVVGKSVRALFGRGLKEAILALGEGEIKTIKNGKLCRTKLWADKKTGRARYDDELLEVVQDTSEKNGTEIDISITDEKIKIPELKTFKEQLSKHYALRDINSSEHRTVNLTFEDLRRESKTTAEVKFTYPEGQKVFEEEVPLPSYRDRVKLVVYESPQQLDSPRYNPYGLAGILIKTKGAILENRLFKFENEPAALYFWGEAICEGLEERLRKGEREIIDFNRAGLEWRHEYCQELATTIEKILEPLVIKKRKALEKKPEKEVKESTKKILKKLCNLLNELAKKELEDIEGPPVEPGPDITNLVIKPEVANIQKDKPRVFSIYAPAGIVKDEGNEARIESDNIMDIQPLASVVKLEKHPKYPEKIWYRYFKVVGRAENAEGTLSVILGRKTASAKVRVAPPKESPPKGKPAGRKGGFISDIKPDELESPVQRTFFYRDTGIIKIFVKFPSVEKFIKGAFEGVDTEEGKILLAELVGEAFCRELARRKLETNPPIPGAEIDAFNDEVNKIQKTTLHQIQELMFAWKFKD